ncbi:hypothetical protein LEN26_018727 [Aphanomyces euteiches]|nr:hypothetical protein LEN26_018727 [Aphanomyces euteiches]KAH9129248.1 hypothetical protein AeMF1_000671 [Aphanomyces euteiches]KAH9195576.1 hypothetical protein AeNC1_002456 [Aphanomyces euteiches]
MSTTKPKTPLRVNHPTPPTRSEGDSTKEGKALLISNSCCKQRSQQLRVREMKDASKALSDVDIILPKLVAGKFGCSDIPGDSFVWVSKGNATEASHRIHLRADNAKTRTRYCEKYCNMPDWAMDYLGVKNNDIVTVVFDDEASILQSAHADELLDGNASAKPLEVDGAAIQALRREADGYLEELRKCRAEITALKQEKEEQDNRHKQEISVCKEQLEIYKDNCEGLTMYANQLEAQVAYLKKAKREIELEIQQLKDQNLKKESEMSIMQSDIKVLKEKQTMQEKDKEKQEDKIKMLQDAVEKLMVKFESSQTNVSHGSEQEAIIDQLVPPMPGRAQEIGGIQDDMREHQEVNKNNAAAGPQNENIGQNDQTPPNHGFSGSYAEGAPSGGSNSCNTSETQDSSDEAFIAALLVGGYVLYCCLKRLVPLLDIF